MRLLTLLFPFLAAAVPLSIPTRPASPPQPQPHQKALALPHPITQLSPANSFSTASSIGSTSDASTKSANIASKLTSLFTLPKPPPGEFKCHRYPRTAILPNLSTYITTLLRSYRESVFGKGKGDRERMLFETCYAGYEAGDVNPSIYFGHLAKKQSVAVEKLVRNQVLTRFPTVEVVRSRNAIAVVMREGEGLRRRNTV